MFRSTTLTLFFAIGIGILFLGVLPLWTEVTRMSALISDAETLIAELQNLQQRKDQLVKVYNSASEENIQKLEAVIPAATGAFDESFLYLFLENVARENGLRLESIAAVTDTANEAGATSARRAGVPSFQAGAVEDRGAASAAHSQVRQTKASIKETKMTLTVKGEYASFKAFLNAVESNLRLIDVTDVAVESSDGKLRFKITLKTYHQ